MKVIGITGGVGAGKSTVLDWLLTHSNSYILKADDIAKKTMQPGEKGYEKTVELFGREILDVDGVIDRPKLAKIIFEQPNKRMVLNSIIHPLVKSIVMETVARLKAEDTFDYVFLEAALLIEDHYEVVCDEIWYVFVSEEIRRKRLKNSRGYTDEKIDAMFASQLTDAEFREKCEHVIDNGANMEITGQQLEKLLQI